MKAGAGEAAMGAMAIGQQAALSSFLGFSRTQCDFILRFFHQYSCYHLTAF